ncbi:MAG: hypothetical protein NZM06_06130 [Chloroherpetonaceae bacterium]|nr:hypothetical protein [Chloroherpetonaceae bacterium]MDW8437511.1 hypothetical protein [Chloroherpetonaceae bacterium]
MNGNALNGRKLAVAFLVSPAMMFLAFLFAFERFYSAWAERNAKTIAETWLRKRFGYEARVDSVAIALSSLTLFGTRFLDGDEVVAELDTLVFQEPSLLALMIKGEVVARAFSVRSLRSKRKEFERWLDSAATFSASPP